MKKIFLLCSFFACSLLFAQTEEELFGSADDDFFFDDGIEEFVETKTTDDNGNEISTWNIKSVRV